MDKENQLWFFFQFLKEVEKEVSKEEKKQVMIEKAINLKLMCDYVVSCSYGDIVLIICMLHDYVRLMDETRNTIQWEAYYRDKFIKMADRLSEQIGYDYDAAMEKCEKNMQKKETSADVGEEAMALALKYGNSKKKEKTKEGEGNETINNK